MTDGRIPDLMLMSGVIRFMFLLNCCNPIVG